MIPVISHRQKDVDYVHTVKIEKNSLLYEMIGKEEISVNSLHNYHIPCVHSLKVSAISEDGLIEAIENTEKRFVLGVQWHPEGMTNYDENARKILSRFIKEAQIYAREKLL